MDKTTITTRIEELRRQYAEAKDETTRKVIAIRGKMLKRALQIMENKEPPQKSLLP